MEALKRWGKGKRIRRWGPILVALGVGFSVFWEVKAGLAVRAAKLSDPRYLVAARPLAAQLPVSLSDLTFRFAGSDPVPKGAITDQELHLIGDSVTTRSFQEGEFLNWSGIASSRNEGLAASVPRGMRAHRIEVESGPPLFAKDKVDIFWRPLNREASASLLLEAVRVLRVTRESGRQGVVVAVAQDDIPALEKAVGNGTLSLSVRNPDEAPSGPRRNRGSHGSRKSRKVEIWTERS